MPPNPADFMLSDQGNTMVSFVVQGASGPYGISIERQHPGAATTTEGASTTVPAAGQADATAPPAGVGYGMQPCPKP